MSWSPSDNFWTVAELEEIVIDCSKLINSEPQFDYIPMEFQNSNQALNYVQKNQNVRTALGVRHPIPNIEERRVDHAILADIGFALEKIDQSSLPTIPEVLKINSTLYKDLFDRFGSIFLELRVPNRIQEGSKKKREGYLAILQNAKNFKPDFSRAKRETYDKTKETLWSPEFKTNVERILGVNPNSHQ